MKNWKNIAIPPLMQSLELDSRGYPVPFIVMRDNNNNPHFIVNDDKKVEQCIKEKKCSICGNEMFFDMWMIGGPLSAFHPQGVYIDIPVHKQCGEYALQVCPYLAVSTYNGKKTVDDIQAEKFDNHGYIVFVNPTQSKERVPFFAFCRISGYEVSRSPRGRFIIPKKPYLEVELWNDGEQITKQKAKELQELKNQTS